MCQAKIIRLQLAIFGTIYLIPLAFRISLGMFELLKRNSPAIRTRRHRKGISQRQMYMKFKPLLKKEDTISSIELPRYGVG